MKNRKFKSVGILMLLSAFCGGTALAYSPQGVDDVSIVAQTGKCSGIVLDASGLPIIGASVLVKGTTNGTVTNVDGEFSISNVEKGSLLQISYIGYKTKEVKYSGTSLKITLEEDSKVLGEVVVTALGIKREKKALGYSMQEVKGADLLESHESNITNALSGKVSGLQIIRSNNGPAGSSKIQLRGSTSVTGDNQPLIVVDGIPMDNFIGASNNDLWNPSADMGNGLSDINPDDIESMSVLKGASAAALYGSRAGNGVILITTKSGHKTEGLGINVTTNLAFETNFMKPELQSVFGEGATGAYDPTSGLSWGPKIEGQEYTKWNGEKARMRSFDNIGNYFKNGISVTESVSFTQQVKNLSLYTSVTRMDDFSKVPGTDLKRTNITTRGVSHFGKDNRWMLDAKVQYINMKATNRPFNGLDMEQGNTFLAMALLPRSLDIRDFSAGVNSDGNMLWYSKGNDSNPYWLENHKKNIDTRDRFLLSGSLKYRFTSWLNAEIRAGSDIYSTQIENKTYAGSAINNSYYTGQKRFYENNFSFLITAQKDNILGKWGGNVSFGGNLMDRRDRTVGIGVNPLLVPDLFTVNNAKNKPDPSESIFRKKINSLYGTAQINYDGYLFLDATFRNDWSSTMTKENRSYFYPSVSGSWVVSEMLNKIGKPLPNWFTYAKARVSYAEVGNDLQPYQLYNTYSIGMAPDNTPTASRNKVLYNPNVRSELIKSWEAGAEIRFFENRLGIDFSWYKTNATNQLLNLPMDNLSGYEAKKINAGNIQNSGIELMINARPIQTHSGFIWDLNVNFSTNRNKIIELYKSATEEIKLYSLGQMDETFVYAVAGGNYGEIWGHTLKTVTDPKSPYFGKLITAGGLPQKSDDKSKVGDQQAKALLGVGSTFKYKGWALNFLIDSRIGGEIFSGTNVLLQKYGTAAVTVVNGKRDDILVDGVEFLEDGSYKPNTVKVTPQQYWQAVNSGNIGIAGTNIYDATNVRLRTLGLSYSFNKKLLKNTPFTKVNIGFTCNNVWMISSHMNGVDPESVFATGTNATGLEMGGLPTSRTYAFNFNIGF